MTDSPQNQPTRLDRWLWAARAFKSRSLAAQACDGGKVSVNGTSAKPHKAVHERDLIEFPTPVGRRRWRVLALSVRRGPASTARELYADESPPPEVRAAPPSFLPRRDAGAGRPTKRDRRRLDRLRSG